MSDKEERDFGQADAPVTRRKAVRMLSGAAGGVLMTAAATGLPTINAQAQSSNQNKEKKMSPKAFVYTEVQISVPFEDAPWQQINDAIRQQPGFLNKTWLSGVKTNSLGGIYAFDSVENAQKFVTGYFPQEAGGFGAAHNTRVFDAGLTRDASLGLDSPHYGAKPAKVPGAFVYTEVQVNLPFDTVPWQSRNTVLKKQKGLIAKTWLSGLHTNTVGGIDAFDTLENATAFAIEAFPQTAKKMNAAFYTRVFDAGLTEQASRDLNSPFYL